MAIGAEYQFSIVSIRARVAVILELWERTQTIGCGVGGEVRACIP